MISFIGNVIWFIFGGLIMGLAWCLWGILAFITIIGIPWSRACFTIAGFAFFPFGRTAVPRKSVQKHDDFGTGAWGIFGNIIWFLLAGLWLAIGHVVAAVACFITIIGIPFAIQHLKLAYISLAPIGMSVVSYEDMPK